MAPLGKIYSYPGNFRAQRAQVAAALGGVEVPLADDFKMRETNASPEYLAKFPMGKVPAFEGADGFCLTEGAAIATYVARSGSAASQLLGADPKTQALITQWTCFAETELSPHSLGVAIMVFYKFAPLDDAKYAQHLSSFERAIAALDSALAGGKEYLVADTLTLADVMVHGVLNFAFTKLFGPEVRSKAPNVEAYFQRLSDKKEFKDVFGALEMVSANVKA